MQMGSNTILVTGGGSGIGRALAEAFHKLGNHVIIAGRRKALLDSVVAENPGMKSAIVDVQDSAKLKAFAAQIAEKFPSLNVLINNAGILKAENLNKTPADLTDAEAIIETNLLGPIRLTASLLPLLKKQTRSTVMTVSSGLAFLPLAMAPTYCATKAAIHSYTESLRYQLKDTAVEVLELVPPYVATELGGAHQAKDPHAMPLVEFITEVMEILQTQPKAKEICVKRVYPLRFAAEQGQTKYEEQFRSFNESVTFATSALQASSGS
jgi:uncharacterized oxidoreductase